MMKKTSVIATLCLTLLCLVCTTVATMAASPILPVKPEPVAGQSKTICFDLTKWVKEPGKNGKAIKIKELIKSLNVSGKKGDENNLAYYFKVTKIKYTTKNTIPADPNASPPTEEIPAGTEREIPLPDVSPKRGVEVDISNLPGGIDDDERFCITVETYTRESDGTFANTAGLWNGEATKVNVYPLNEDGDEIVMAPQAGPGAVFPFGDSGELLTVMAGQTLGLSAEDIATSDLMFTTSVFGTGTLRFVPTEGLRFNSVHTDIYVLSRAGTDITSTYTFGDGVVKADGSYEIPVESVEDETFENINSYGVIVRGVEIEETSLATDVVGGYVVSGDALSKCNHKTSVVPLQIGEDLVANWAIPTLNVTGNYSGHLYQMLDGTYFLPQAYPAVYGGCPHVFSGSNGIGHLYNICVESVSAGSFSDGTLYIQPIDSAQFVESDETQVYFFDAQTNENLTDSFESTLTYTTRGSIKVSVTGFTGEGMDDREIRLVVRGPKLAFDAPMIAGQTERVMLHGSMLKVPVAATATVIEGSDADVPQALPASSDLPNATAFIQ